MCTSDDDHAQMMLEQVDTSVPIAQAQKFYMALKERKVPVEFVVYPRENHRFLAERCAQIIVLLLQFNFSATTQNQITAKRRHETTRM
jgi:dienelactone hydrolase